MRHRNSSSRQGSLFDGRELTCKSLLKKQRGSPSLLFFDACSTFYKCRQVLAWLSRLFLLPKAFADG